MNGLLIQWGINDEISHQSDYTIHFLAYNSLPTVICSYQYGGVTVYLVHLKSVSLSSFNIKNEYFSPVGSLSNVHWLAIGC